MSTKTCYGMAREGDEHVVLALTEIETGRWQVADPTRFGAEAGPPADLAGDLVKAPQRIHWLLNEEEASVSTAAMPRLKAKQLKKVVKGWIVREQGGTLDEWVVDWHPLAQADQAGESVQQQVAVAYAKREVIDQQAAVSAAWGLKPGLMLPDYLALDLFFRRFGPDVEGLQGWNLVFLGRRQRFLCIGTGTHLLLTRMLPVDLSDGSNPAEYLDQLATEVDRSVFFARQTQQNPEIEKIIICGDPVLSANLAERMASNPNQTVEQWDLSRHFNTAGEELSPDLLLTAAAAALIDTKVPLNLAPHVGRTLLGKKARKRALVALGTLCGAAVPMLLIGGLVTTEVQERYLDRARERLAAAEIKADEAADVYRRHGLLLAQEDYIRSVTVATPDFEDALLRLANLTPRGIIYRDLQLRKQGDGAYRLRLAGISDASSAGGAQETFLEFLAALATCDFLTVLGEPSRMEITAQDDEGVIRKQVVFSLDYSIQPASPGVEG